MIAPASLNRVTGKASSGGIDVASVVRQSSWGALTPLGLYRPRDVRHFIYRTLKWHQMTLGPKGATVLVATVASLSGAGLTSAPEKTSISADDLRRDVFILASDEMGGRLVGTEGNRQAATFIADRYAELGLTPVGADRSYRHVFELIVPRLGPDGRLDITRADHTSSYAAGNDFFPERFSGTGEAEGPLVFVGFGISAPELGHDDYRQTDLNARVVVMLDHEPGEQDRTSPFDGDVLSEYARSVRKALEAQRRGASAVLFVSDVHNHPTTSSLGRQMSDVWPRNRGRVATYQLGAWVSELRIPVVRISTELAEDLLAENEASLATVTRRAETPGGMTPVEHQNIVVDVAATVYREQVTEHNVVGLIEGTDPLLRDEWIIVCAHYDHEGTTASGIFNGADDDASGVAGLLEIAEAYTLAAARGQRPKRSILLAAWNAEERGLLGAWAYTERPLTPLGSTVAVINMDMIGRSEEVPENGGRRFRGLEPQTAESNADAVNLIGYSYSGDLRAAAEAANVETGLDLRFRYDDGGSNLLRRSDHWPFLTRGVPALFVHTGLHPDYHTERDQPETLDYEKMSRIVQLVHELSWNLAQSDTRPMLD